MTIFVNGEQLAITQFPGGERHVTMGDMPASLYTSITAYLHTSDDIMDLLLVVDAIRRVCPHKDIDLAIPYFPYARQDRVCNPGEAFSAKVMAGLINGLQCTRVTVHDPHSDVVPALLDRCEVMTMADLIEDSELLPIIVNGNLALVSPDAGAEKKVRQLAKRIAARGHMPEVIVATKVRDTATGVITATEVHGDVAGKDLLVVDDICDGGRTFIELAKVLRDRGAGDLYLYVTHGIFSQGVGELLKYYAHLYCCHCMQDGYNPNLLTVLQHQADD